MAVLTVWERLSGKTISRRAYINLVLIGFLLVAFFLSWREEHNSNAAYQQELSNPGAKLTADTDENFIYSIGKGKWFLVVLLSLTNVGKNDTIAKKFEINCVCPDKNDLGVHPLNLPKANDISLWDLGDYKMQLQGDEYLENRLANRAVLPGNSVRGWVTFEIEVNTPLNCKYMINFQDSFGRSYFLRLPTPEKIPPKPNRFVGYPGISNIFVLKRPG